MALFSWLMGGGKSAPARARTPYAAGAARFAEWAGRLALTPIEVELAALPAVEEAIDRAREAQPQGAPEALIEDAACWIGEATRRAHGGEWEVDALLGPVVGGVGAVPGLRLRALSVVETRWREGPRLRLAEFFAALPRRIDAERALPALPPAPLPAAGWDRWRGLHGDAAADAVLAEVELLRARWRVRYGAEPPTTLNGLREIERLLRTQAFVWSIDEALLAGAGFLVGEVARGLYGGAWDFRDAEDHLKAALVWPELPYYPLGRVYRLAIEQPAGESLDEYVRLVPSARSELRKRTAAGPTA